VHAFVPVPGGHAARLDSAERTVIARLVADTAELRALTEDSLRAGKVSRLQTVWRELCVPAGPQDAVVVRTGQEGAWLAALTDVRLVLASRLGIEGEDDAEEVYTRARRPGRLRRRDAARGADEEVTDALATMYAALTWWQESLLDSMRRRRRAH
jgi:hypothetical protein